MKLASTDLSFQSVGEALFAGWLEDRFRLGQAGAGRTRKPKKITVFLDEDVYRPARMRIADLDLTFQSVGAALFAGWAEGKYQVPDSPDSRTRPPAPAAAEDPPKEIARRDGEVQIWVPAEHRETLEELASLLRRDPRALLRVLMAGLVAPEHAPPPGDPQGRRAPVAEPGAGVVPVPGAAADPFDIQSDSEAEAFEWVVSSGSGPARISVEDARGKCLHTHTISAAFLDEVNV